MSSRRHLFSWLLLGLTGLAFSQCRRVGLCDDADSSCRPDTAGGSDGNLDQVADRGGAPAISAAGEPSQTLGGSIEQEGSVALEAGAAGAAGAASTLPCTKPWADCDVTPLNGCETNVSVDPNHCGACDAYCDGLCVSSRCLPFEVLSKGSVRSNLEISTHELYFLTGEGLSSDRLVHVDPISKQAETLAQNLPDFEAVAVGADRVYLWADYAGVWSVLNGSHLVVDEGIQLDWLSVTRQALFWLDSSVVHRRRVGAAPTEKTDWVELSGNRAVELAANEYEVLFLQRGDPDLGEPDRISTLMTDDAAPTPRLLVSERGEIVRWRLYDDNLYWLTRYGEGPLEHDELRRIATFEGGKPELLLSAPRIEDFALNGWVFAHCPSLPFHEIKAFHPSRPNEIYRIGTPARPERMEADRQGRLYFFQFELGRLLSSDVSWLN